MNWAAVLRRVAPSGCPEIIAGVASSMPAVINRAQLATPILQAHFLAQCAHESDGFKTLREYASGKEYEGRRDLGNIYPGDGVRYKGRGLIELTGRANYGAVSRFYGVDFVSHPELLETFPYASYSAAFFWTTHGCNAPASRDDIEAVTRIVNGGYNGLSSRRVYLGRAKFALGVK